MKKLKAFTLVELIVVIAIFGIIMTGVVQMINPINTAATSAKVINNQQTVESSMSSYIGENLRYANNLLIIEQGCDMTAGSGSSMAGSKITVNSAETAIDAFMAHNPVNAGGNVYANTQPNRKKVKVIAFDGTTDYSFMVGNPKTGTGRIISSLDNRTDTLDFDSNQLKSDGSKPQYMVFGESYYGPADYYMNASLDKTSHVLDLRITSNYYYNNSKRGTYSDSDGDGNNKNGYTTYQLRNYGLGAYMFKCIKYTGADYDPAIDYAGGIKSPRSAGTIMYFVYTDEDGDRSMTIDGSLSPNPTIAYGKCSDKTETTAGPVIGEDNNNNNNNSNNNNNNNNDNNNTGNTGSNTGNTGSNTGNTGSNTGNTGNNNNQGGSSNVPSGMAVTVGNASATIVTEGKGVYGMAPVGENGVSVKVGNDPWNTLEMTITKNENGEYTYTASFTGGSKYILDSAIFPDLWANDSYNLNAAQIEYLNNNYGLTLG